jgi:hypothetical protein
VTGFYFSRQVGEGVTLCLAPITERRLKMAIDRVSDPSGYFLYELTGSGDAAKVEIIARVSSDEGVHRLRRLLDLD